MHVRQRKRKEKSVYIYIYFRIKLINRNGSQGTYCYSQNEYNFFFLLINKQTRLDFDARKEYDFLDFLCVYYQTNEETHHNDIEINHLNIRCLDLFI